MKHSYQMLSQDTINSVNFLDFLREQLREWSLSLFDPISGGFRCNENIGVNVMSTTDIVWIRYAANDLNPGAPDRDKIVKYLHGKQDPDTGRISHDYGDHSDGHAFWQTVRALRILDAQLPRFPAYMEPMLNPSGLDAWFMSFNWDGFYEEKRGNHHEVLGLIPAIASLENDELAQCLFRNIEKQQNRGTGTWPRAKTNISRTFAYTALHLAAGGMHSGPVEMNVDISGVETLELRVNEATWFNIAPNVNRVDVRLEK
jgi:hypothetical protein